MNDLAREVAALRLRLRLQTWIVFGMLTAAVMASGGGHVVASAVASFFEADAWTVKTKDAGGTLQNRLVCTTDVATARIKVQNANLELASQNPLPSTSAAGAIGYDGSTSKFKYHNGSAWTEPGGPSFREFPFIMATTTLAWSNQPSSLTEILENTGARRRVDLTGFTQFRFSMNLIATGASGSNLRFEYSTNGTSWANLQDSGTSADMDLSTAGPRIGAYGTIATAARADVFIRIMGYTGGSSTGDPSWRSIALQVK